MPLTTHADSHLDHGLSEAHVDWLLNQFADKNEFFIDTVELPEELAPLQSGIHGPIVGDDPVPESEVHYACRGDRPGESRLCSRPERPTQLVTVIAGPHDGQDCVLFTAYGGPCAPREPTDPDVPAEEKAACEEFWASHALSAT